MSNAVIRDADEMEKFANSLTQYEEDVKALCDNLQVTIGDAVDFMRDERSMKALTKISETLDEIKAELPEAAVMTKKLKRSSGYVREASGVMRRL